MERLPVTSLPGAVQVAIKQMAPRLATVKVQELDVPIARLMSTPPKWEPLKNFDVREAVSENGTRVLANRGRLVGQWPAYHAEDGAPIDLDPLKGPWFIVHYYVNDYGPEKVRFVDVTAQKGTFNKALWPGASDATRVQLTKFACHLLYILYHFHGEYRSRAIMEVRYKYGLKESARLRESPWLLVAMDELIQNGLAKWTSNRNILLTPQGVTVASRLPSWADPMFSLSRRDAPDTYLAGSGAGSLGVMQNKNKNNVIDEGSFSNAVLNKAGGILVRESLAEGVPQTTPLAVQDYEMKYCQSTKGGKVPECRVHVTSANGTSMAVRLCDKVDGEGTVIPVANADEALLVARKFCKCARGKSMGTRKKCARKVRAS